MKRSRYELELKDKREKYFSLVEKIDSQNGYFYESRDNFPRVKKSGKPKRDTFRGIHSISKSTNSIQ